MSPGGSHLVVGSGASAAIVALTLAGRSDAQVTVLDIGQGSSILVETEGNRLLFDAASGTGVDRSATPDTPTPILSRQKFPSRTTKKLLHGSA